MPVCSQPIHVAVRLRGSRFPRMDSTRRSFIRGHRPAEPLRSPRRPWNCTGHRETATALARNRPPQSLRRPPLSPARRPPTVRVRGAGGLPRTHGHRLRRSGAQRGRHGRHVRLQQRFPRLLPAASGSDEGLLFINHEYPGAVLPARVRCRPRRPKSPAPRSQIEQPPSATRSVHVSPGDGRRLGGRSRSALQPAHLRALGPLHEFTGRAAGDTGLPGHRGHAPTARSRNCSGGITPWGTALTCEENFRRLRSATAVGTSALPRPQYDDNIERQRRGRVRLHGLPSTAGCASTTRTTPSFVGASTPPWAASATRTRPSGPSPHAVRALQGDDKANGGLYKFVSDRPFKPGREAQNLEILTSGTLYIASWEPQSRRMFDAGGDVVPTSATSGTGTWVEVHDSELHDTSADAARRSARSSSALRHQPPRGRGGRPRTARSTSR